jgi:adenylosuccinate synthase
LINYADIVCGLCWGDEAKGKITASLASTKNYNFVCRWAGGNNAGHTIYVNGEKLKTHLVPAGIFYNVPSIIGPGCVVNKKSILEEFDYLSSKGFDTSLVKISGSAHVVTDKHIDEDKKRLAARLGTTSRGIAPCYSDKMGRTGIHAREIFPESMLWDENLYGNILCEGAQGVWLDVDWGNYPYVTSSTTLPYGACSLGIPPQAIRKIYGAAKIYDTRSGSDPLFPEELLSDPDRLSVANAGKEYGVTTGRRRKVNWLNLAKLIKSINISGATDIIISKVDVLELVNQFHVYDIENKLITFKSINAMQNYVKASIMNYCSYVKVISFSSSPEHAKV